MSRTDAYRLSNLPRFSKVFATFILITGIGLFVSGWFVSVSVLNWGSTADGVWAFGAVLAEMAEFDRRIYYGLLGVHLVSLLVVLLTSRSLFARTPLPRVARRFVFGVALLIAGVDLACWWLAPPWSIARAVLGPNLILLTLVLLALVGYPIRSMWLYTRWPGSVGEKKRVVVVGGGFAGLDVALGLDRALGRYQNLEIVVVDQNNFFLFPPLLPSVAAGAIETRQVTYPFRRIFEATNIRFRKEVVERVDPKRRIIHSRVDVDEDVHTRQLKVRFAETSYDYLILAPGSTTNTFGTPGVEEHAFFMREIGDAVGVRNHVIDCFEHAAREEDPQVIDEMLRFVVVGAGPTGVELASEVRELVDHVLLKHYPEIDAGTVEVVLVQSGDRILPGWSDVVARNATRELGKIKVDLRLGRRVVRVGPDWVDLDDGARIPARTCVWCSGVKPAGLLAKSGLQLHRSGRVEVGADCRAVGWSDVFVLGDAAYLINPKTQQPFPPLGQVAFQQGKQTADNISRLLRQRATRPFEYFDYGQLVSVGARCASIDLMGVRLTGFLAWLIWRTLYLSKLVGFGNKVRVMLDWTLDLLVERSISQLYASRKNLEDAAGGQG